MDDAYIIVSGESPEALAVAVNAAIMNRYHPIGGVTVAPAIPGQQGQFAGGGFSSTCVPPRFMQALIHVNIVR